MINVITYLDFEIPQIQPSEDFIDNLDKLCIRYHWIILSCNVKILWKNKTRTMINMFDAPCLK